MKNIVICGYYGFDNIGDDAILGSIIDSIRKTEEVNICVLSYKPNVTADKYDVRSVDRKNPFKVAKEIKKSDVLVFGGGSLLQNTTSKKSLYYYLGVIMMAVMFNKKVMMYSQGIGPIYGKTNRKLTGKIMSKVDYITLRDRCSKDDLVSMGVDSDKILVSADPVIGLNKVDEMIGKNILSKYGYDSNKKTIGFAFKESKKNLKLPDILIEVSEKIKKELDVNIVFIPFHNRQDNKLIDKIEGKISKGTIVVKEKLGVEEMLSLISNFDLLIGCRLHSLIFASVAQTPVMAVSYDPKIDYYMDVLKIDVSCTLDDLNSNEFYEKILGSWKNRIEIKETMMQSVENMRDKLALNEEIIRDIKI